MPVSGTRGSNTKYTLYCWIIWVILRFRMKLFQTNNKDIINDCCFFNFKLLSSERVHYIIAKPDLIRHSVTSEVMMECLWSNFCMWNVYLLCYSFCFLLLYLVLFSCTVVRCYRLWWIQMDITVQCNGCPGARHLSETPVGSQWGHLGQEKLRDFRHIPKTRRKPSYCERWAWSNGDIAIEGERAAKQTGDASASLSPRRSFCIPFIGRRRRVQWGICNLQRAVRDRRPRSTKRFVYCRVASESIHFRLRAGFPGRSPTDSDGALGMGLFGASSTAALKLAAVA